MSFKTALFVIAFVVSCFGALWMPIVGILGYMLHYFIGPERQWWTEGIQGWGLRYSFSLAAFTAVGVAMNFPKLNYGRTFFKRQEKLMLLLLGALWLSVLIGEPMAVAAGDEGLDHPAMKMTKVVLFILMLTHVVTTVKELNFVYWAMVIGSLFLGYQAWSAPPSAFYAGRIEMVGGVDFREVNGMGAFMAGMLPLIGVQFLRSGLVGRIICMAAGAFAANAIILTRSRGAAIGILGCLVAAIVMAPRKYRGRILIGAIIAGAGVYYLADPAFLKRAETIQQTGAERDESAQGRLDIWDASLLLLQDKPQGVGVGNFFQAIGRYNPAVKMRDAHSTFVRCYSELGVQGFAVFVVVILNAGWTMYSVMRRVRRLPPHLRDGITYASYGLVLSVLTLLVSGSTVTLLYTEGLWWLLAMPVCVERAMENLQAQEVLQPVRRVSVGRKQVAAPALRRVA